MSFEVDTLTLVSLWSLQFRSELAELGRRWPVVLKEARERGDRHMMANLNTFLMSTLRLAADDPEAAEAELRLALGQWTRAALAYPIRAGVAAARGDRSEAARLFAAAVTHLEAVDMNLYAAAARRRLGELLGGSEGQAHVVRADSWMRQQTIQDPARMANVFVAAVA